jgi:hypothetical protein
MPLSKYYFMLVTQVPSAWPLDLRWLAPCCFSYMHLRVLVERVPNGPTQKNLLVRLDPGAQWPAQLHVHDDTENEDGAELDANIG